MLVDVDDAPLALRDVELPGLEQPHQDVLHVLAHVPRFGQRGGVGDGEGDIEDAGEGLGQQGLADAGGPDEEDVRLVELDSAIARLAGVDALVMVVHRHRERALGPLLPDDVLVQHFLDFAG